MAKKKAKKRARRKTSGLGKNSKRKTLAELEAEALERMEGGGVEQAWGDKPHTAVIETVTPRKIGKMKVFDVGLRYLFEQGRKLKKGDLVTLPCPTVLYNEITQKQKLKGKPAVIIYRGRSDTGGRKGEGYHRFGVAKLEVTVSA